MPAMSAEAARFNQAGAGIGCSVVYPLVDVQDGAALIFSFYQSPTMLSKHHHDFMQNYANLADQALNSHSGITT